MPNRPDFSDYLAHFTAGRPPLADQTTANPTSTFSGMTAKEKLISILETKQVKASKLPWTGRLAVCLTECPWSSLIDHADRYSPYGIGFTKPHVFAAGGGPVYYVRADHWDKQNWDPHLKTFATPFWPGYRPPVLKTDAHLGGSTVDYSHEREWRVPHDFRFEYHHIAFVIVASYKDMAEFPQSLKDEIGRDKFIIMDVYKNIENLWPVHNL